MAVLSYTDLAKRDNISVFVNRVNSLGKFNLTTDTGELLTCTGKAKLKMGNGSAREIQLTADALSSFLKMKKTTDYIEVECKKGATASYYKINSFFKDKEFGGVAGKSSGQGSERQEQGLIELLNSAARKNSLCYDPSLGVKYKILGAKKNEGLSSVGQEPYIDVFIKTSASTKPLGISLKGESAPSLAGGGVAGIKVVAPELLTMMYEKIEKYLTDQGYTEGTQVYAAKIPDLFIKIPKEYLKKILVGNEKMGGPVDYMYVGKMDVVGSIGDDNKITVNGKFYDIDSYMNKVGNLYFRIRKRDLPADDLIQISFKTKNKEGYPIVFMTPKTNKNNFRLVIIDKVPSTGAVL
jgi:hypothetical protein